MNDPENTIQWSFEGKGDNPLAMYLARQNYKAALIGRELPRESEQGMRLAAEASNLAFGLENLYDCASARSNDRQDHSPRTKPNQRGR